MKKKLFFTLFLISALLLSACSDSKLPPVEQLSAYSEEALQSLVEQIKEADLVKAWGEPQTAGYLRLWPMVLDGENKYLVACVENDQVIDLFVSRPLFITVAESGERGDFGLVSFNGFEVEGINLCFLPSEDVFGNALSYRAGDLLLFESDGCIMETYPCQLSSPYSVTLQGQASQADMEKASQIMSDYVAVFP